ncbi:MAG: helix-turn-helix domain-containing protein, partial [Candidatus Aenigmarchaeota archaeon]|nr:helix-turn-helix domain-containing protein [Candidatus Aenigmarchaeota archaeon]
MNTKIFQSLGLTEREAEVYLILLDTGSTTTGQIIKKSGLHKATVYSILQRLVDQGLVNYIMKEGIRYFESADPETFLDVLREREEGLLEILPELKKKKEQAKQKQEAYILEGLKGLKASRDKSLKILSKGDELLVLGASRASNMALESYWINYHNKRVKEGIKARMLWNETAKKWGKDREKLPYTQLKYLPKELETPANIDIYKNIVDISVFAEKPFIFHIENKTLADSFRNYFNLLWNQDVRIYRGFDAVTEKFWSMMDPMKQGDEYLVLGANYGFGGQKLKEWFTKYHVERVKRKIKAKLLTSSEAYQGALEHLTQTGDPGMKFGEIKRLPPEFSSPMQINLYKPNKVLMFLWGKEEMVCFEIESALLYKNFKNYFDGLWNQEIKTVRGLDGVKELFLETLFCGELRMIGARGYLLERVKGFY